MTNTVYMAEKCTQNACQFPHSGKEMENRWLSVDEIAEHLGVKRDTVYKWIDRHGLPARKIGRLWKFRRNEIDQWVDQQPRTRRHENHQSLHQKVW